MSSATAAAIQLASGANAVATSAAVRARLAELQPSMPSDVAYAVSYDTAPFVKLSIVQVAKTLGEAGWCGTRWWHLTERGQFVRDRGEG